MMASINYWEDYKTLPGFGNINKQFLNAREIFTEEEINEANKWAKFWFFEKGPNTFPGDTKHKQANILYHWNNEGIYYQDNPIPLEIFNAWLEIGLFAFGICVVAGKCWRGPNEGLYLNVIDCDNSLAFYELCKASGMTREEMYQKTIVEEHMDEPGRCHVYILSDEPFPQKASDKSNKALANKIKNNEIPSYEVKSQGLVFCTNSLHKNGKRYGIKGVLEI
jgi:hypothetical protein